MKRGQTSERNRDTEASIFVEKQETSRGIGNANLSAHSVIVNLEVNNTSYCCQYMYPDTLGVHGEKER